MISIIVMFVNTYINTLKTLVDCDLLTILKYIYLFFNHTARYTSRFIFSAWYHFRRHFVDNVYLDENRRSD